MAATRASATLPRLRTGAGSRPLRGVVPVRLFTSGLAVGAIVTALLGVWALVFLGGFSYYTTPLAVRAYSPAHRLLRPSGPIGQTFGVVGGALMLVPFAYVGWKRVAGLRRFGTARWWLEVHFFCGIVGPVLVTLHTSFKFNGIVSAAYWSMVIVMLSGFVGRFLYVRIPRSLRGVELTRAEADERAEQMHRELAAVVGSEALLRRIDAFERSLPPPRPSLFDLVVGEFAAGVRVRAFEKELTEAGVHRELRTRVVAAVLERVMLLRRVAYLQKTRSLFELWHVLHLPLVYLMLVIVAAHVAVALYLGYVPFRW